MPEAPVASPCSRRSLSLWRPPPNMNPTEPRSPDPKKRRRLGFSCAGGSVSAGQTQRAESLPAGAPLTSPFSATPPRRCLNSLVGIEFHPRRHHPPRNEYAPPFPENRECGEQCPDCSASDHKVVRDLLNPTLGMCSLKSVPSMETAKQRSLMPRKRPVRQSPCHRRQMRVASELPVPRLSRGR